MTIFCLRDNLFRDTAPVPFSNFIFREKSSAVYQTCTATAPARNKDCTMMAKSTPYLSCHRDYFSVKAPVHVAGWLRKVTQPSFIAGPLGFKVSYPDKVSSGQLYRDIESPSIYQDSSIKIFCLNLK
jgi:hypothetical protein